MTDKFGIVAASILALAATLLLISLCSWMRTVEKAAEYIIADHESEEEAINEP